MISERKRRVALPIFSLDYCGRYHWKEGKLQGSGVISRSFINSNKTSKKQINKKIFRWFLGCYKFSEFSKAILGDFRWFWEHWPPCLTQVLQPCTKFLGLTVPYFFRLYWVKMTYQTKSISSKENLLFNYIYWRTPIFCLRFFLSVRYTHTSHSYYPAFD